MLSRKPPRCVLACSCFLTVVMPCVFAVYSAQLWITSSYMPFMQSCQRSRYLPWFACRTAHTTARDTVWSCPYVVHVCAAQVSKQVELSVLQVDAKVLLGDRRLHITLARVWAALTAWEKTRLVWMFVHSGLTMSKIKQDLADEIESLKVCLTAVGCLHWCACGPRVRCGSY